jgi:Ca-activated chloride channel homolog
MTMPATTTTTQGSHRSEGGRLVATDGRALPLRGTAMTVEAAGGIARVVLRQRFVNPHAEPLCVRYQLPLPADGAVSAFAFELDGKRIVGEIDRRAAARQRYEEAIVAGKSAALLEQDRSSLFTQEVGNVPPGAEITAEIAVDQKLRWLAEGSWEWRFPTVVAPRYLGAEGRVADAERVTVDVADGEVGARATLAMRIGDALAEGARPESSSHPIAARMLRGATEVSLRDEAGAHLDRDVVVSWPAAGAGIGTRLELARPPAGHRAGDKSYALLTVVPPKVVARDAVVPRDLSLLLDVSGSMHGEPIAQLKRAALALVDELGDEDTLSMFAFAMRVERWNRKPLNATASNKAEARRWLGKLEAGGGTEMKSGILAALEPLREGAQRQVVLVSDGLIGFEQEIVTTILERLPRGSRVHTVGVGSGVNRSLTGPAARAGRGVEVILAIGEDPERAVERLVKRTSAPVVVDLALDGDALLEHAPRCLPDLFAGAPALLSLALRPAGGKLTLRGATTHGSWEETITVPGTDAGSGPAAVVTLFGRERVEDLEMLRGAESDGRGVDGQIETLGIAYQIATRMTSWVAVSADKTVDPTAPTRREQMPHELPHGMSVQGLGLRQAMPMQAYGLARSAPMAMPAAATPMGHAGFGPPPPPTATRMSVTLGRAQSERTRAKAEEQDQDEGEKMRYYAPQPPQPGPASPEPLDEDGPMDVMDSSPSTDAPPPGEQPPMAQPPARSAPKRKASLGQRLGDGIRRIFGADVLRLRGRVVLRRGDRITIEIDLISDLEWDPRDAMVVLADGTELLATVVVDETTRAGTMSAGQTVRLTLRYDGTAGVREVHLESGARTVHLSL